MSLASKQLKILHFKKLDKEQQIKPKETRRNLRRVYEQLFANKFENVDKVDKFFKKYNVSKLIQEIRRTVL